MKHAPSGFDRVAKSYLPEAHIQKEAALKLISLLELSPNKPLVLDLGSGPGTLLHGDICYTNTIFYDLSYNMLAVAREKSPANRAVLGNAESLPFADNSFDIVISNLMIQWLENKYLSFTEICRVLKPSGRLVFTTLVKPSLHQLIEAWSFDVDSHVLEFLDFGEYVSLCQDAGLEVEQRDEWSLSLTFKNFTMLMQHFKQTGTASINKNHSGLRGKAKINQFMANYPRAHPELVGVPLSYCYGLISARKNRDVAIASSESVIASEAKQFHSR